MFKSFQEFLNEFELEGEHQTPLYLYLVIHNIYYDGYIYMVVDSDYLKEFSNNFLNKNKKLIQTLTYDEANKSFSNKTWTYYNPDGEIDFFSLETNQPFKMK